MVRRIIIIAIFSLILGFIVGARVGSTAERHRIDQFLDEDAMKKLEAEALENLFIFSRK